MVVIRLARSGAKKKPFYHLVVADKRMPRDGRYIEKVGYYNPVSKGKAERLEIHRELIQSWIDKGAQPSPRVSFLIRAHDLGTMKITAEKTATKAPAKKAKTEDKPVAEAKVEATKEEKPKAEAKPAAKAEAKPKDEVKKD
jgi:small subunit ribosomal protein S16